MPISFYISSKYGNIASTEGNSLFNVFFSPFSLGKVTFKSEVGRKKCKNKVVGINDRMDIGMPIVARNVCTMKTASSYILDNI
jgi:hypothetical protein